MPACVGMTVTVLVRMKSISMSFSAGENPVPVIRMKNYYVYIMANERNGTLYIGVTNNLIKRVYEHKNNLVKGFSQKYQVHLLVYYEITPNIAAAITREKQLKHWNRAWKLRLIEENNPDWKDLYNDLI
jgi:putative endonuclease